MIIGDRAAAVDRFGADRSEIGWPQADNLY
jgi:hypothetical protein